MLSTQTQTQMLSRTMSNSPASKTWCLGPGFYSRWTALAASFLVNAFNLYR